MLFIKKAWPYLILILFIVLMAGTAKLNHGYNVCLDEGFLQSVGSRLLNGQSFYGDFYYLKPPLPVYIQAGLMALLEDSYNITAARVYLVIQLFLIVLMTSLLYRKYVNSIELCLLLIASYVITSMLLTFPWYSYDGLFFAVLAALLFDRKHYLISGFAVFLAFMCKQNYILILPILLIILLLLKYIFKKTGLPPIGKIVIMAAGFLLPSAMYGTVLLLQNRLLDFIANIWLIPMDVGAGVLKFAVVQNLPEAIEIVLPFLLALIVIFYVPKGRWLLIIIVALLCVGFGRTELLDYRHFVYLLVGLNYTAIMLWVIEFSRREGGGLWNSTGNRLPLLIIFALIIQYMACFNFGGILFGYMGAGVALPFTYIILKKHGSSHYGKIVAPLILVFLVSMGIYHKYSFVYHDSARTNLTAKFQTAKLAGIMSTPRNVAFVEDLISVIDKYSDTGDYIFVCPDYSSLYYLTDRRNPTRIDWYYTVGWYLGAEPRWGMLAEAAADLRCTPPKLILINSDAIPPQFSEVIAEDYMQIDSVANVKAYVPVSKPAGQPEIDDK